MLIKLNLQDNFYKQLQLSISKSNRVTILPKIKMKAKKYRKHLNYQEQRDKLRVMKFELTISYRS